MAAPSSRTKALLDAQRNTYRYGTIELEHDNSDEENINIEEDFELDHTPAKGNKALPTNKRWSVLEKLDRQYTPRDGRCTSCLRNISKRCALATLMLVAFFVFAWYFTRTLLFNIQLNPDIYDFIIVGGGPTGAVVARRLLDEGATVLLLESGDFVPYVAKEDSFTETSVYGKTVDNTISEFDIPVLWSAVAQKEEVHFGPFDALNINAFRGLGGGGMQSALLYVRALSSDILGWDVSSFDWETMLGAYVQLERFQYSAQSQHPAVDGAVTAKKDSNQETDPMLYRGTQGNFPTNAPGCTDVLGQSFLSASLQQGEPYLPGFNSPAPRIGVGCYEVNVDQGVRVSPVKAMLHDYLASTHAKERLTLRTGCTARRLLLDRQRAAGLHIGIITQRKRDHRQQSRAPAPIYRATGVEYVDSKGETKFAYLASGPSQPVAGAYTRDFEPLRCLVLAAGAIHTPVLLMNSGVGPEEQLMEAGVEVKVDSPRVGRGLQDHIAVGLTFQTAASATSDFGSAYAFPQQWSTYTKAVHRAMRRDDSIMSTASGGGSSGRKNKKMRKDEAAKGMTISETTISAASSSSAPVFETTDTETFGLLGDNGVSAGAFLASPWAADPLVPDIQLTLFPAVTEPHFLALMSHKASVAAGNNSDPKKGKSGSFRDQILFTIALLAPEARFQISLNKTHPLEGPPSVRPVPDRKQKAAEKSDGMKSSSTAQSVFHDLPGQDKNKFAPSSTPGDTSAGSDPAEAFPYNIVPGALTERDVQRLTWAVQRVRAIVRGMRLPDLSALVEVSPGQTVGQASSSVDELSSSGNSTSGGGDVEKSAEEDRELATWVRENTFFQSNWVGSAGMGRSAAASYSAGTKEKQSRTLQEGPVSGTTDNKAGGDDGAASDDDDEGNTDKDTDRGQGQNDFDVAAGDQVAGSSVVDEHLSVRNVLALKIADASVIPHVPSGNVQATVQAVAWRAADFILKTFD